jgi:hypothetical protein
MKQWRIVQGRAGADEQVFMFSYWRRRKYVENTAVRNFNRFGHRAASIETLGPEGEKKSTRAELVFDIQSAQAS